MPRSPLPFLLSFLLALQAGLLVPGIAGSQPPRNGGRKDKPAVSALEIRAFERWLEAYLQGNLPFVSGGRVEKTRIARCEKLFRAVASSGDLTAAKRLWPAATLRLRADLDKFKRLAAQPDRVRNLARRLIAGLEDPRIDAWLLRKVLRRGSGRSARGDRSAAVDIIGRRRSKGLGALLQKRIYAFPLEERIPLVLVLEKLGDPSTIEVLLRLLKDREPNLRIAAIQALTGLLSRWSDETKEANLEPGGIGARWTPEVVDRLGKILKRDPLWQVRAAACDGLATLKTRLAIPVLIEGFAAEVKRGKGRSMMLVRAFHDALAGLTGRDLPEASPQLWADFWKKEGARFRFRPGASRKGGRGGAGEKGAKKPGGKGMPVYVKYFDFALRSRRVLFVVDFSGSMAEKVTVDSRYAKGRKRPKYEIVKKELEKVIRSLPRDTICNVVFFSSEVAVWKRDDNGRPALVKMTDRNKSDLLEYVWSTEPGGATNVYGALETALSMGERGVYDKFYKAAYDTLYFLSDGAPTWGRTTDTKEILAAVRKTNALRRIRIHTIVFGNERNNLTFMKALAAQNGGRFLQVR